jgi:hypothetical protein
MSFVLLIVGALLLLDVLWWMAATRLLRHARWKLGVTIAHTLFIVLQFAGLIVVILSRRPEFPLELPRSAPPSSTSGICSCCRCSRRYC